MNAAQTKVYYAEIYPVVEKKLLGIFKVKEVEKARKLGTRLEIFSNVGYKGVGGVNEIYLNGKKVWEKRR